MTDKFGNGAAPTRIKEGTYRNQETTPDEEKDEVAAGGASDRRAETERRPIWEGRFITADKIRRK